MKTRRPARALAVVSELKTSAIDECFLVLGINVCRFGTAKCPILDSYTLRTSISTSPLFKPPSDASDARRSAAFHSLGDRCVAASSFFQSTRHVSRQSSSISFSFLLCLRRCLHLDLPPLDLDWGVSTRDTTSRVTRTDKLSKSCWCTGMSFRRWQYFMSKSILFDGAEPPFGGAMSDVASSWRSLLSYSLKSCPLPLRTPLIPSVETRILPFRLVALHVFVWN
mmetsp:Transcript_37816/g.85096  ORF Transcript_37816/g.85096 Transcript_37816/m.85096 type:complete len:224 (+) Transcript_37816:143-814(+)